MTLEDQDDKLAGVCGLYCGNCIIYRIYHDNFTKAAEVLAKAFGIASEEIKCYGCRSSDSKSWSKDCYFKKCAEKRGIDFCYKCEKYPCPQLLEFANAAEHRKVIFENNQRIREVGLRKWLEEQDKKWRCPVCKGKVSFYNVRCPHCGNTLKI